MNRGDTPGARTTPRRRTAAGLSIPRIAFVVLCLLLCGCGRGHPELASLPADAVILAFGDSLTHGTGARASASYPAILTGLTGRRVINAGIPGELSAAGLTRLPGVIDETNPQLIILCHGGNDMLRKRSLDEAATNLREMVALARGRGIDVVLVGVPKPGLLLATADFYSDVANEAGVPIEDDVLTEILGDAGLKSDPIHPNAAGYRVMAEALHSLLRSSAAL